MNGGNFYQLLLLNINLIFILSIYAQANIISLKMLKILNKKLKNTEGNYDEI